MARRRAAAAVLAAEVERVLSGACEAVRARLRRGEVRRLVSARALVLAIDVQSPERASCAWATSWTEAGLMCAAALAQGLAVRVVWPDRCSTDADDEAQMPAR